MSLMAEQQQPFNSRTWFNHPRSRVIEPRSLATPRPLGLDRLGQCKQSPLKAQKLLVSVSNLTSCSFSGSAVCRERLVVMRILNYIQRWNYSTLGRHPRTTGLSSPRPSSQKPISISCGSPGADFIWVQMKGGLIPPMMDESTEQVTC